MDVADIVAVIAGASLAVTVIVLLVRGSYQLGKLVDKVDNQEQRIDNLVAKVDALETKFDARFDDLEAKFDARLDALTATLNEMAIQIQQTNRILVGLANHPHDADGRTVFTIPQ